MSKKRFVFYSFTSKARYIFSIEFRQPASSMSINSSIFYREKCICFPVKTNRQIHLIPSKLPYIFSDGIIRNYHYFTGLVFDNPI
jgi:hypothetical protein